MLLSLQEVDGVKDVACCYTDVEAAAGCVVVEGLDGDGHVRVVALHIEPITRKRVNILLPWIGIDILAIVQNFRKPRTAVVLAFKGMKMRL